MMASSLISRVAMGLSAALVFSAALAQEGSLVLPERANANLALTLPSGPAETELSAFLQVFVGTRDGCCAEKPPMAGRYQLDGNTLTFDPAFEFIAGQTYTVKTRANSAANNPVYNLTEFSVDLPDANTRPELLAVYPSGDDIPENTLRFYLHFSTAMQPHVSTRFIKLLDETGNEDAAAFMAFKQELWSEDRKRLTLLMDPGRIKRGVAQNRALGPALRQGRSYSIAVEEGWLSAGGTHSAPRFEKTFTVSSALRTRPDTNNWVIAPLNAQTRDPLVIRFDRPFDRALAKHSITVLDQYGQRLAGEIAVGEHERSWRFDPQEAWTKAPIHIAVDPLLEDVAGNNFSELLDHAVDSGVATSNLDKHVLTYTPLAIKVPSGH